MLILNVFANWYIQGKVLLSCLVITLFPMWLEHRTVSDTRFFVLCCLSTQWYVWPIETWLTDVGLRIMIPFLVHELQQYEITRTFFRSS